MKKLINFLRNLFKKHSDCQHNFKIFTVSGIDKGKVMPATQGETKSYKVYTKCNKKIELKNPYQLTYYNRDWSEKQTAINNTKYWKWEMEHNNFKP